jgi:hypothetical protein
MLSSSHCRSFLHPRRLPLSYSSRLSLSNSVSLSSSHSSTLISAFWEKLNLKARELDQAFLRMYGFCPVGVTPASLHGFHYRGKFRVYKFNLSILAFTTARSSLWLSGHHPWRQQHLLFFLSQSDLVIEAQKQDTHTYTKTLVSFHKRKYRTFPTSLQARSTLKWIRVWR